MKKDTQKTPRELAIEKGEGIVIAIGIYFILFDMVSLLFLPVTRETALPCTHPIQWVVTFGLCFLLYRGRYWARIALAIFNIIGIFVSSIVIYRVITLAPQAFGWVVYMLAFMVIPYGVAAYLLLFSSDIDEMVKSRKR